MSERVLIIYCGLLLTISAFSIDITLPQFQAMSSELAAPMPSLQATVTIYIFAIGIGQVIVGPLSDRFGRRPAVAAGMIVYLVGALVSAQAPSIAWLLFGRALQGVGGAAGAVVARAIIRDRSQGIALARNMALATGIFSVGPIFAPLIGVGIAEIGGSWRAMFVGLFAFGLLLLLALARVPETLAERQLNALSPATLMANGRRLFGHPQSRYFMALTAVGMSLMVTIIASAPLIYQTRFGLSGAGFAVFFAMHGFGIIFGQILNHRLIVLLGVVGAALAAAAILIAAATALIAAAAFDWLNPYLLTAIFIAYAVGYLSVMANSTALIIDPHGAIAGFTASIAGCVAQFVGAVLATLVVLVVGGDALRLGIYLLTVSAAIALALVNWRRRQRSSDWPA
jgi:DHA1 family bicyclomycin/chloramphenicol resistance-like MFS transporter